MSRTIQIALYDGSVQSLSHDTKQQIDIMTNLASNNLVDSIGADW